MIDNHYYAVDAERIHKLLRLDGEVVIHYPSNKITIAQSPDIIDVVNRFVEENDVDSQYIRVGKDDPGYWKIKSK